MQANAPPRLCILCQGLILNNGAFQTLSSTTCGHTFDIHSSCLQARCKTCATRPAQGYDALFCHGDSRPPKPMLFYPEQATAASQPHAHIHSPQQRPSASAM